MIVILSMTNLSALVPGLIAMYICVCMIIVDLRNRGRERDSGLIFLCSKTRGDSIRLAPEDISPQLVVGILTGIKNVFTSVVPSC